MVTGISPGTRNLGFGRCAAWPGLSTASVAEKAERDARLGIV